MITEAITEHPSGSPDVAQGGRRTWLDYAEQYGIYLALVALIVTFSLASPFFLTTRNLANVGNAAAITGVLAAGMTIALIAGQLDLSVGSVLALTSVAGAVFVQSWGLSWPAAIVLVFLIAALVAVLNGVLIVNLAINSIITTLAISIALRGLAQMVGDGQVVPVTADTWLQEAVNARPLGVPVPLIVLLLVYAGTWIFLNKLRSGWHVYAIGGNPNAALRAGVRVNRITRGVFIATAAMAAIGGVLTLGRAGSGSGIYGNGVEFDVLTAVLLGGIGMGGGSGRIEKTLAGVLLIGVLNNGMTLLNFNSYHQQLARGLVFVLAVVLSALAIKKRAR